MAALHRRDAETAEDVMKNHLLAQLVALRRMAARQEAA
jgi:DNA-binding GntR family transcriptional regulator